MNRRQFMEACARMGISAAWLAAIGYPLHASEDRKELTFQVLPENAPKPSLRTSAKMRDGIRLITDVWLPTTKGRFPAVLTRTPYIYSDFGFYTERIMRFQEAGYAYVLQTVRGQHGSEGIFRLMKYDWYDGYDSVEWVAAQPWCDGSVAMDGISYMGLTQIAAAAMQPPHLKAIMPIAPEVNFFESMPYLGGIFHRYHNLLWLNSTATVQHPEVKKMGNFMFDLNHPKWSAHLKHRPLREAANKFLTGNMLDIYLEYCDHPLNDDYWDDINFSDEAFSKVEVPMYMIGGHYDATNRGTLHAWKKIQRLAPPNPHRHLFIGPYTHGPEEVYGIKKSNFGPHAFRENVITDNVANRIEFLDQHLRGGKAEYDFPDKVRVYITGINEWHDFVDMPVPEAKVRSLYLSSQKGANSDAGDGKASFKTGSHSVSDTMTADPENPIIYEGIWGHNMNEVLTYDDVLVYTTEEFTEPLTIVGEPKAILYVSCDTPDADILASMHEVRADGQSVRFGFIHGLRLRYRNGYEKEELLTPGKPVRVQFSLQWIGHTVLPGNRLRVVVKNSEWPLLDPNPNTGEPIITAVRTQKARISLLHSAEYPSRVEIPTVSL